jgi:hypothetical protein
MIAETLPDDIQYIILSYLDPNTRLSILKQKYPIDYLNCKLNALPKTSPSLKKLYTCTTNVKHIWKKYLNKEDAINKEISLCIDGPFRRLNKFPCYYFDKLEYITMTTICNYTKMYENTDDKILLCENEMKILNLYNHIIQL